MLTILPKITKWTEILGILLSGCGAIFKVLHYAGANELLQIGLLTLASTYFLSAFIEEAHANSEKPKTFIDSLPPILRKMMFISLAVYLIGFLFAILHLEGANQMLILGVGTLVICTLLSMVLILGNRDRMTLLKAPLIRSVVVLLIFLISYLR